MTEDRIMGQRAGIRWAIATLHKYAGTMNDPKAKAVLNAAAHVLALDAKDLRAEDASDIAAGLEALNTPIVATWPEVRDRLGLGPKRGDRVTFMDAGLDEVFVHEPVAFHLEYMANNQVWMRVDRVDQPAIVIWLTARGKITGTVQED